MTLFDGSYQIDSSEIAQNRGSMAFKAAARKAARCFGTDYVGKSLCPKSLWAR